MPVSGAESPKGEPTSWSAEVDQLCSGAEDETPSYRLFVVAAGNAAVDQNYPDTNLQQPIDDPAQAWNALTVGAATFRATATEPHFSAHVALAAPGHLSPHAKTTVPWQELAKDRNRPIKPEVVFEGGNVVRHPTTGATDTPESLQILTTKARQGIADQRVLTFFNGTSAAAALGANMAAEIWSKYPNVSAQAVRALMIHSARWGALADQFDVSEDSPIKQKERLLRTCGWGVPQLDVALSSAHNDVCLIVEEEFQPFIIENGKPRTKDMHLHKMPWPMKQLEDLGEAEVRLRLTLSYFVEPNRGVVSLKVTTCHSQSTALATHRLACASTSKAPMRICRRF